MPNKRNVDSAEAVTAYHIATTKRHNILLKIKRIKDGAPNYDHNTVKLLLQVARKLSNARSVLLDNYYKAYCDEHGYNQVNQAHFIDRKQGRVK